MMPLTKESPVLYVAQLDESYFDEYPHWRQYIEQ